MLCSIVMYSNVYAYTIYIHFKDLFEMFYIITGFSTKYYNSVE